jgi:hypothetical protein
MLTAIPLSFTSARKARHALTYIRRTYRLSLRGACVTGPDFHGAYTAHYPAGGTGFSPAEMAGAMQSAPVKPTKATRYFHEAAQRCRNGSITVDIDSGFSTVAIDAPGQDGLFMQGDEADTFIEDVRKLCKRYPSLDEDTAALALAEPYAETLFN